jgi:predicted membrane protein
MIRTETVHPQNKNRQVKNMNLLLTILVIVAVILLITGGIGFGGALQFLLWIGIVLAIIAIILFIVRAMGGRTSV